MYLAMNLMMMFPWPTITTVSPARLAQDQGAPLVITGSSLLAVEQCK